MAPMQARGDISVPDYFQGASTGELTSGVSVRRNGNSEGLGHSFETSIIPDTGIRQGRTILPGDWAWVRRGPTRARRGESAFEYLRRSDPAAHYGPSQEGLIYACR